MTEKAINFGVNRMKGVIKRANKHIKYEEKIKVDAEKEIEYLQKICKHDMKQEMLYICGTTVNTCKICGFEEIG